MTVDEGETWDLSDNDVAAITAVLNSHAALVAALTRLVEEAERLLARPTAGGQRYPGSLRGRLVDARAALRQAEGTTR